MRSTHDSRKLMFKKTKNYRRPTLMRVNFRFKIWTCVYDARHLLGPTIINVPAAPPAFICISDLRCLCFHFVPLVLESKMFTCFRWGLKKTNLTGAKMLSLEVRGPERRFTCPLVSKMQNKNVFFACFLSTWTSSDVLLWFLLHK